MPRNWLALKGHDEPLDAAEVTVGGGRHLLISPLQGLLPEKEGVCFETQAVGRALLDRPFGARSIPNEESSTPNR